MRHPAAARSAGTEPACRPPRPAQAPLRTQATPTASPPAHQPCLRRTATITAGAVPGGAQQEGSSGGGCSGSSSSSASASGVMSSVCSTGTSEWGAAGFAPSHALPAGRPPGGRPPGGHGTPRRHVLALPLAAAAAAVAACAGRAAAAEAAAPSLLPSFLAPLLPPPADSLLARLQGAEALYAPGVAWSLSNPDRQLYYPPWLEGEWAVTARFVGAAFPQGKRLLGPTVPGVKRGSMAVALPDVGAAMDAPLAYRARWVASPLREGAVEADRAFNAAQLMDAFYGSPVTRRVEYDPRANPTRMSVVYATPRRERSVISEDLRKAELLINNRSSEYLSPTDFMCSEFFRQVSQAASQGGVTDYEVIARYTLAPGQSAAAASAEVAAVPTAAPAAAEAAQQQSAPATRSAGGAGAGTAGVADVVRVRQRVAAYLEPQDASYFEARGRAVAHYEYEYTLERVG